MREVKEPEVRKGEIIEAAKKMFFKKGYLNTTTQDIINEAGISRGLLYYHFKSKEDILFWLVEQQAEPILNKLKKIAFDASLCACEKVKVFLESTIICEDNATEEAFFLQETMELPENSFIMDKMYHKLSYAMKGYFTHIIEQGNEEGVFEVQYPEQIAAFLMISYVFVSNDTYLHNNEMEKAMNYLNAFKQLLNQVLGTKEALFDV